MMYKVAGHEPPGFATWVHLRRLSPDTQNTCPSGAATLSRDDESGFSLIEVIVSLAIVSLVSLAGFTLIDTLAGLQSRIDARYDAIQELQLMLSDLSEDFAQAEPASLTLASGTLQMRTQVCNATGTVSLSVVERSFRRTSDKCKSGTSSYSEIETARFTVIDAERAEWDTWPTDEALHARAVRIEIRMPDRPGALTGSIEGLFDLPDTFTK